MGTNYTYKTSGFDLDKHNYLAMSEMANKNILSNNKSVVIFESMANLEALYISSLFFKFFGCADIQYSNYKVKLNGDLPNFFNLNRSFKSFENISSLLIIGTHPRYEASVLNSILRMQQMAKSLAYYTLVPSLDFKLKTIQEGNGFRSLVCILENRLELNKALYREVNPSIVVGADNFKSKNGFILQNVIRVLGKKLFVKTLREDRLAILHSNITSLNTLNLGLDLSARSDLYLDSEFSSDLNSLIVIEPYKVSPAKWVSKIGYTNVISFTTHEFAAISADLSFPVASLYENNGTTFNIEGRLRQFYQAVSKPGYVAGLEETLLSSFLMVLSDNEKVILFKKLRLFWLEVYGSYSNIKSESEKHVDFEKINVIDEHFVKGKQQYSNYKIKLNGDLPDVFSLEAVEKNYQDFANEIWKPGSVKAKSNPVKENSADFHFNFNYFFNYYTWEEPAKEVKLCLLSVLIEDFYMNDLISENSVTMGHAALFSQNIYGEYLKSVS